MHVIAIYNLATEFSLGYFKMGQIVQEDNRRPPDWKEEGARLGHARCCALLGKCYHEGNGTEVDHGKCFKWSKKAAEKGDTVGMRLCAHCYESGEGVERSRYQALH